MATYPGVTLLNNTNYTVCFCASSAYECSSPSHFRIAAASLVGIGPGTSQLDLQVVAAAKEITHLPIAVDPSHATFWRPWVEPMTLASIASGADAIMLEVHPDPDNSAVDPLQPINYNSFSKLMKKMDKVAKSIGKKIY